MKKLNQILGTGVLAAGLAGLTGCSLVQDKPPVIEYFHADEPDEKGNTILGLNARDYGRNAGIKRVVLHDNGFVHDISECLEGVQDPDMKNPKGWVQQYHLTEEGYHNYIVEVTDISGQTTSKEFAIQFPVPVRPCVSHLSLWPETDSEAGVRNEIRLRINGKRDVHNRPSWAMLYEDEKLVSVVDLEAAIPLAEKRYNEMHNKLSFPYCMAGRVHHKGSPNYTEWLLSVDGDDIASVYFNIKKDTPGEYTYRADVIDADGSVKNSDPVTVKHSGKPMDKDPEVDLFYTYSESLEEYLLMFVGYDGGDNPGIESAVLSYDGHPLQSIPLEEGKSEGLVPSQISSAYHWEDAERPKRILAVTYPKVLKRGENVFEVELTDVSGNKVKDGLVYDTETGKVTSSDGKSHYYTKSQPWD